MTVSVILPTFNVERWIAEQLAALADQICSCEWELVIADNGSTDDTRTIALGFELRFGRFKLVDASGVRGPAHARNQGVRTASGELLLFTDADDIVRQGWIAHLTDGLRDFPLVTGPVEHFEYEGVRPSGGHQLLPRPPGAPLSRVIGGNMGMTRELFFELGGFDETLQFGWSDFDFAVRADLRGTPIGWEEQAVVQRRRPTSVQRMWNKEFVYGRGWTTLERRYPHLSPRGWRPLLRRAGWIAVRTPYIAFPDRRRGWVMKAAQLAGRVVERLRPST